MTGVRMAAFDLDGTLLEHGALTREAVRMLRALRKNGVKVVSAKENISDGPEGIILESMLEGMAEYYSAELKVKVQRGTRKMP